MDETYVGGKPRKENKVNPDGTLKQKNKRGRGTKKTPVVGAVDRLNKQIHCKVALPNEDNKALTGKTTFSRIRRSLQKKKCNRNRRV